MIQTMKKLKSGYINGTRVMLGNLSDFINTSAITDLSFLGSQEDGYPDSKFIHTHNLVIGKTFLKQTLNL
jgi:TRAP-type C4-dicarboxylate transport system substrate-binding protein